MLFTPLKIRSVELANRVVVSPMCQYSAIDGLSQTHHNVHYGQLAMGGAGLTFVEATAVTEEGRITNGCLGLWSDEQGKKLSQVVDSIKMFGSVPGIQLGHAGQKGSMQRPWHGNGPQNEADLKRGDKNWRILAPTSSPLDAGWLEPVPMTLKDLDTIKQAFVSAANRALDVGFEIIEIHMAHGYLLHSFLSPISNKRSDEYGGSIEGRMKYPLQVIEEIRNNIPDNVPLFVRISSTDAIQGGWEIQDSIVFAAKLKGLGVDVIDCSSGGNSTKGSTNSGGKKFAGFQVPFAHKIRSKVGIKTQAVGLIRDFTFANSIVVDQKADLVALGRQILFNPFWPNHAREFFGKTGSFEEWPIQYAWWLNNWKKALLDIKEAP